MLIRNFLFGIKAYTMQWKSPQNLREFQEKRLRYIVRYAYENSKFYRKRFKALKIDPAEICTLADLQKIPPLTKTELRENFSHVISREFSEKTCFMETTSGSTGEHMKILHDPIALDYYSGVLMRGHMAIGLKPHHKTVYIRYKPLRSNILQKFGLYRFYHLYSDLPLDTIIAQLKEIRPFTINCYPTIMYLLAKKMSDADLNLLSLHHIVTWSEQLTPKIRNLVENRFGCPVYDQYGAYEFHSMAFECCEKRMHINADAIIMEFVQDGEPVAPGEPGEIAVTSLWNRAMPFIRYKVGDIGVPSDHTCACGRGLPVMANLVGRIEDFLVKPSGEVVLPSQVITLFYPYDEIDVFQVVQKKKDKIHLKIVRGKGYSEKVEEELLHKFKEIFGEDLTIKIEYTKEIKKATGGKQRTLICEVK
jgi:phenylacetate-CoA ligase